MDTLAIWFMLIALIVIILILCWSFYKYFVKPKESTSLVEATFIISLSTSFILVLFIPVDIYLTSNGNFEISNFAINQSIISRIYNFIYWSLVFQAYVVIPFSYFYFKNQSNYYNEFDDDVIPFENAIEALKNTVKKKR